MTMDSTTTFASTWTPPTSTAESLAQGRARREQVPRSMISWLTEGERDPVGIIEAQNATRVPELVPLRSERMSANPFAFYRGTAALQAADLAADMHSGILVPSCGDAHVANFGFYASPQRTLAFDLNDFDEAAWAPWEWDVKRLTTSLVVAGQSTSRDARIVDDAVLAAVRAYARAMAEATQRAPLARYFDHFDVETITSSADKQTRDAVRAAVRDAQKRTGERAARKLTERRPDGRLVFVDRPPTMVHSTEEVENRLRDNVASYVASADVSIRMLMANYSVSDIARRVVGVGSVGTQCSLVLFQDGAGNALILQGKEARRSVLVDYGKVPQPAAYQRAIEQSGEGARVVALQRVLQAVSDPFLGYLRAVQGDFYIRQFHDMKGGIDADTLEDDAFRGYAEACAATLARAHAQSPETARVAGYIGNGRVVGESMLEWSYAYAALSKRDYDAFVASLTS